MSNPITFPIAIEASDGGDGSTYIILWINGKRIVANPDIPYEGKIVLEYDLDGRERRETTYDQTDEYEDDGYTPKLKVNAVYEYDEKRRIVNNNGTLCTYDE